MRHHGFLAVAAASTIAASGWILSRSHIVDASEEQGTSFREAYAQTEAPIRAAEDPDGLRLNYFDARWSRVLQDVARHAELTLVMEHVPPGRFARRDRTRYATADCLRILNRELEGLGYRLLVQQKYLIVLPLDQARTRYARPTITPPSSQTASKQRTDSRFSTVSDSRVVDDEPETTPSPTTIPVSPDTFQDKRPAAPEHENLTQSRMTLTRLPVRQASAAEVARAVYLVFERRAELVPQGLQGHPTFVVYAGDDSNRDQAPLFRIGIDQKQNELLVESSTERIEHLTRLLQRLDKPKSDPAQTQLVAAERLDKQTTEKLNQQMRHLVAMQQQNPASGSPTDGPPAADAPGTESDSDTETFHLRGDVNIQAMQELGVLLIEGNEEDLERLAPIIETLEQMSVGSLPDIHLLELNHVNSEAFATLLREVYTKLAELRQREEQQRPTIDFFPVVQPNSVLILAPRLELPAILDLADKLDQQLDPGSEFQVFALKHAIASQVVTALDSFYEERQGLGTRIRTLADARTNSVVVQGHPRDLAEVQRLIQQLDADQPGAVHKVEVVPLQHATAEELAEVLNAAIQAVTSPPQTGSGAGSFGGNQGPQELRDTKSIALEFLATDGNAQNLIRSGFLMDVRINPDPRSNTLIVSAPDASMPLLKALIQTLDQAPSATAAIKVFALKNADAEQSVELLTTMFENTNQEEQLGVQISGAEDAASSLIPLQFTADIRTNTVLAVGSEEALSIVEAILLRLDTDDARQRTTQVIPLKNAPAERVSESINTFLEQQQELQDSSDDLVSNIERIRQEVIVAEDLNSNSLIVSASPEYFSQIMGIIETLDAAPPQVIIQALLVEVQLDNTDEFGVELGFQDPLLFQRSIVASADDLITIPTTTQVPGVGNVQSTTIVSQANTPGLNFNNTGALLGNNATGNTGAVGAQSLSNFSLGRQNSDLGFGGFVFSAQSDAVNVLIRALAARRTLHILSRPQIRTTHNNEASIRVGQEVPIVNGVTQTAQGTTNPTIEQRDTGIILRVRPRITPDGNIAMEVYAEKSALTAGSVPIFTDVTTGNTITSPIRDISIAETTVNVPNGQTIVIGGMITKSDETLERKVPWLGDLPLLGKAFRYDSTSTARTELLIFLTPRIIYGDADSELIKQVEAERTHFLESEAEEVHGPLYSVPAGRRPVYEPLHPEADQSVPSFQPGVPPATPPVSDQARRTPSTFDSMIQPVGAVRDNVSDTAVRPATARRSRTQPAEESKADSRTSRPGPFWVPPFLRKKNRDGFDTEPTVTSTRSATTDDRRERQTVSQSLPDIEFDDDSGSEFDLDDLDWTE